VRNQGSCGSCWAFATVGAVESAYCLKTGSLTQFSEQYLTSCETQQSRGCSGGFPDGAIEYVAQHGICKASDYPYTSGNSGNTGQCNDSCEKVQVGVKGAVSVNGGDSGLASAIDRQPVVVVVAAGNSVWKQYSGGVVSSCDTSNVDHAVLAVGYSENYFKIRNSWGSQWGENGYILLQRGGSQRSGTCEILSAPSYPSL